MVQPSTSAEHEPRAQTDPKGPVRTCVGCRRQAARSELVRVTLIDGRVVVDESATQPGRGAWLHRDPGCLETAIKRRAFPRAFREGVADASSLTLG